MFPTMAIKQTILIINNANNISRLVCNGQRIPMFSMVWNHVYDDETKRTIMTTSSSNSNHEHNLSHNSKRNYHNPKQLKSISSSSTRKIKVKKKKNKFHVELDKLLGTVHNNNNNTNNKSNKRSSFLQESSSPPSNQKTESKRRTKNNNSRRTTHCSKLSTTTKEKHSRTQNHSKDAISTFSWKTFDFFASCLPGLEPLLMDELRTILTSSNNINNGEKDEDHFIKEERGGVSFRVSNMEQYLSCHLYLGCASHIFLRCHNNHNNKNDNTSSLFTARGKMELRRKVSKLSFWKDHLFLSPFSTIEPNIELDIRVSSTKSRLYHTQAIEQMVYGGIMDAISIKINKENNNHNNDIALPIMYDKSSSQFNHDDKKDHKEKNVVKILVRLNQDKVQISIDTSHTPLHRRGYRLETSKAPLREDIAYSLLYAAGWNKFDKQQQPTYFDDNNNDSSSTLLLVDPFCGSGTIVIEGTSMAMGLPPGRFRNVPSSCFLPSSYSSIMEETWNHMIDQATAEKSSDGKEEESRIVALASDCDEGATQATISNAKRAGVANFINIQTTSFPNPHPYFVSQTNHENNKRSVLFVTNPPFGKRISKLKGSFNGNSMKKHPLLPLYQTIQKTTIATPQYNDDGKKQMMTENNINDEKDATSPNTSINSNSRLAPCSDSTIQEDRQDNSTLPVTIVNRKLAMLANDIHLLRSSGFHDIDIHFSTKHGGMNVIGFTTN